MTNTYRLLRTFFFISFLLVCRTVSAEENQTQYKKITVSVPPFSMNPGEKITGFKFTIMNGKVDHSVVPKAWNCQTTGTPGQEQTMYCSSPSTAYALYHPTTLPVTSIVDMSSFENPLDFEATIELENNDGKTYGKQLWRTQLIVK